MLGHGRGRRHHQRSGARAVVRAIAVDGRIETLRFLTPADAAKVKATFGTPTYVYDRATLVAQADAAKASPNAFGLTVRYAMKASPNKAILKIFKARGLNIDASSGYECARVTRAGFAGEDISLSSQELPTFFPD